MRLYLLLALSLLSILTFSPAALAFQPTQTLTITGLVKRPLSLTVEDLARFRSSMVRINDIRQKGTYHGVFSVQGVALKDLLETAFIEKEASAFNKPTDLAIVVRDISGNKVALSWGEVFYRNPADVLVAYSAVPIMPHHPDCSGCHSSGFTRPVLDQLNRTVGLPKLVIARDFDSDRALEGIVNIEVVNLNPMGAPMKKGELFSPRLVLAGLTETPITVFSLDNLPRTNVVVNVVGDGRGFHGRRVFGGVPLAELVKATGMEPDLRSVVIVSAPDGYSSLVSWGELVLSPQGRNIIIADELDGNPIEREGKFLLVAPDDLAADREIKAAARIEVHTFKESAKLYLIGVGPGDTDLITKQAISCLGRVDAVVAPEDVYKRFASYLAGKPLLINSANLVRKELFAGAHPEIPADEVDAKLGEERGKAIRAMKKLLAEGRSIAYLDWSVPFSSEGSNWLRGHFYDDEIERLPGLTGLEVAGALLGRDMTCRGSLVMTSPEGLRSNQALLKAAADKGDTVAASIEIGELRELLPLLRMHYRDDTPIAMVFNAGFGSTQRKVTGNVGDILGKLSGEHEKSPCMIYVGPCLDQKNGGNP